MKVLLRRPFFALVLELLGQARGKIKAAGG